MEKSQILKQFWTLIYGTWQTESLQELKQHTPSSEELQLLEDIMKLPEEKKEMWMTAFKVIWEFDGPTNNLVSNFN